MRDRLASRVRELLRDERRDEGRSVDERHAMDLLGYERRSDHPWRQPRKPLTERVPELSRRAGTRDEREFEGDTQITE